MFAYEKYRTTTVTTSNSSNQLIFIFDEILRLLHIALKASENKEYEAKFKALSKIIEVFYILKSGINPDTADESTQKINVFYSATITKLEEANIGDNCHEDLSILIESLGEVRHAIIASTKNSHNYNNRGQNTNNSSKKTETLSEMIEV